jgi:hypothetical protein
LNRNWKAERQHQKLIQDMEKLSFCLRLFEKWYDCLQKFQHVAQGQDQAQLNADKEDEKTAKEEASLHHHGPSRTALSHFAKLRRSESMHLSCETCNNSKLTETSYRHCVASDGLTDWMQSQ